MKEFQVLNVWNNHEEFESAMQQNFVDGWEAVAFFCVPEAHPVMEPALYYVAYLTRETKAEKQS